jgi:hypothetical protein
MPEPEEQNQQTTRDRNTIETLQQRLAKNNNDASAVAAQLYSDLLDANRRLTSVEKKLPAENALVLTGDAKKNYESFLALGKPEEVFAAIQAYQQLSDGKLDPTVIKTKVEAADSVKAENESLKRGQLLREVADDMKFKFDVLSDRDKADGGLAYEKRAVKITDPADATKTVDAMQWHVKVDNKWVPLTEHVDAKWGVYKPILSVETTQQGNNGQGSTSGSNGSSGVSVPQQKSNSQTKPPAGLYQQIREAQKKRSETATTSSKTLEERLNMAK